VKWLANNTSVGSSAPVFLVPELFERIVKGRQPPELTVQA
jgi:hypothetical protein